MRSTEVVRQFAGIMSVWLVACLPDPILSNTKLPVPSTAAVWFDLDSPFRCDEMGSNLVVRTPQTISCLPESEAGEEFVCSAVLFSPDHVVVDGNQGAATCIMRCKNIATMAEEVGYVRYNRKRSFGYSGITWLLQRSERATDGTDRDVMYSCL